jgi:hypothetical protein
MPHLTGSNPIPVALTTLTGAEPHNTINGYVMHSARIAANTIAALRAMGVA